MDDLLIGTRNTIERGLFFLTNNQEPNGSFIDFELPPGPSNAWVTGFVAVAIHETAELMSIQCEETIQSSAKALISSMRPGGWGYNDNTATDADSTSFAIRAILRAGYSVPRSSEILLKPYIDENGHGHTFLNPDKMGNWADCHADVTASIGLALKEANVSKSLRNLVINACLEARNTHGIWIGYWWHQPCYATWINLQFLRIEGALTKEIAQSAKQGILNLSGDLSVFDVASILGILLENRFVTGDFIPEEIVKYLLRLQQANGEWPFSYSLILPLQRPVEKGRKVDDTDLKAPCYADVRNLFTTAVVIQVLARWFHETYN